MPGAETAGPEEEAAGREKRRRRRRTTHRPPFVGPARISAQLCALRRPRRVPAAGSWRAADAAAYIRGARGARCRGGRSRAGKHRGERRAEQSRAEHAAGRGGARQARPAATSRGGGVPGHVWPCSGAGSLLRALLRAATSSSGCGLSASSPRGARPGLGELFSIPPAGGLWKVSKRGLQFVHIQPRGKIKKEVIKRKGGSGMSSGPGLGPAAEGGGRLRAPCAARPKASTESTQRSAGTRPGNCCNAFLARFSHF